MFIPQVFNGTLSGDFSNCPYIIGTLNQNGGGGGGALSPSSTTNLQLRHNFRWVLCANHIEPAKGNTVHNTVAWLPNEQHC